MWMPNEQSAPPVPVETKGSIEAGLARLARLIHAHTPHDGTFAQRVPGMNFGRFSRVATEFVKSFYLPSVGIVAQGAKVVTMGEGVYSFGGTRMFMVPISLPVAMQVTEASLAEPYLSVKLDLDPKRIAELVLKIFPHGLPPIQKRSVGYVFDADLSIISAITRLVECLESPSDTELIAPLVADEILIRLLRSPIGVHVAEMGFADSSVQKVAKAIGWLRENFSQQMKVADLADMVHLSVSSFHEHFKAVTSISPLQYQKTMRLHEARRLMLTGSMDATTACQLVGYVSTSQFSRDYSRYFGSPPGRDIAGLRQQSQVSV